ncbi:protein of unknown function DUF6 transmembrane [Stackebrandtia nassauensis DSM 44728]|uniref:EamA domain-containing protein n=2 Tax=Stackebrandtia TaxID=283810 RepID=D3PV30_STANL|nr:protein of unknown function DUF6 transmembrane [Stackebrandtia nassauensis DSM 44728]
MVMSTTSRGTERSVSSGGIFLVVALGIVYIVWGSTYLAIRIMVEDMPPLLSAGARFMLAGAVLAAILAARGGLARLAVTRAELLSCAALAMLLPVLGQGSVTVAENGGAPSGLTALLVAVVPLWVLLYRTLSGQRPARLTVYGVLLGFAGLVLLLVSNGVDADFPFWTMILVVLATMSWAFGSWYQPRLKLPRDPFVLTVYEMLIGGAVLMVAGFGGGETIDLGAYSSRSWMAWVYLVVFGSLIAFSAYVWLLHSAPVSLVATYAYVNPVVAVALGWLVLSEDVTTPIVVGGIVVVLAVAVVAGAERPRRTPRPNPEPTPEATTCR